MSLVRDTRGGVENDPAFCRRMRGEGEYADLLGRRFRIAARRFGLDRGLPALDVSRFRPPGSSLDLFANRE
jgi:hypothetical protein